MSPIDPQDVKEYYGQTGKFMSTRDLKPGESWEVVLLDINKNYKTKYPIAGKEYNYRITLIDPTGTTRLFDANGISAIKQLNTCLYHAGVEKPLRPCHARLSRRTARKKTESELLIEYVNPYSQDEVSRLDEAPF